MSDSNAPAGGTPPPTTGGTGTPPPATPTWTDGLTPDQLAIVQTKGYRGVADVLTSYSNLEKLHGVPQERLLKLPGADAKPEDWAPIFDKLGRPADPGGYAVDVPAGMSDEFAKAATAQFHQLGLSKSQGEGLVKWFNEQQGGAASKVAETQAMNSIHQEAKLKAAWGPAYDQNLATAKATVNKFELTAEQIDGMQHALGFDGVMTLLHKIGEGLGEHGFITGDASSGSKILTPEQAQLEIKKLQTDPEFGKRYINGDVEARNRMEALQKWANPGNVTNHYSQGGR